MTHTELIESARKWLWRKCSIVITEMATGGGEEPDAIGWQGTLSTIVECKASRSDFLGDAKKHFRIFADAGMGKHRVYCAPKGMIKPHEIPSRWGLIEWSGKQMRIVVKPEAFPEHNHRKELELMISALRRTGTYAPSGVSVKVYSYQTQCRATLSVGPTEQ